MRCSSGWEGADFVVHVDGDGNSSVLWRVAGFMLVASAVRVLFHMGARGETWQSGLFMTAVVCAILGSVPLFMATEMQVARSELRFGPETLTVAHRAFFLRSRNVFPKSDVERIGFIPELKDTLPALGLMIRTRMMPMHFGRGLSPDQASDILAQLRVSSNWAASKVIDVGAAMY